MATTKGEFQTISAELLGTEFADFLNDAVIEQTTGFSYDTGKITKTQTVPMIAVAFKAGRADGELVKVGDFKLIGQYQLFDWIPDPDKATATHDGQSLQIVRVMNDPAKAVLTLHVRLQ